MPISFGTIYTPQGDLRDIIRNPNLDTCMNLFRIPRAFSVSGFGDWDVGKHSLCAAFVALQWARLRRMKEARRNELAVYALLHDLHEAVTGDILPFFKTKETRDAIDQIQSSFLRSFDIRIPISLVHDLKVVDMTAFLYEIRQSSASTLQKEKARWLQKIYVRQRKELFAMARRSRIPLLLVRQLLRDIGL